MSTQCPFCTIATSSPPTPPTTYLHTPNPDQQAHLILSTQHVLAFLDIMPLTRGHILVVPRTHYEKLSDLDGTVSREIGQWLPVLSRVLMRTLFGDGTDWNWNVVQNNGVGAAQQVPHAHFHIIPRPPLGQVPDRGRVSFVMFGRGQREELDEEEGEMLAGLLREELAREVGRIDSKL
ncbi:HIT-like domain-containing protein [Aspergillus avenaceus]|uniref:HIT-like domain-containing protein n=1 Tax=Aspergillus avenaceus TaxID=36643 RepID=A0A5N6TZR6_ASPAV|nr:HIT-like domain-containing protein [Aspergillus avenaceus]